MFKERKFKPTFVAKTRGEYGVGVSGGHNTPESPEHISVFDPDFGDQIWISIKAGLASGDWIEVKDED